MTDTGWAKIQKRLEKLIYKVMIIKLNSGSEGRVGITEKDLKKLEQSVTGQVKDLLEEITGEDYVVKELYMRRY